MPVSVWFPQYNSAFAGSSDYVHLHLTVGKIQCTFLNFQMNGSIVNVMYVDYFTRASYIYSLSLYPYTRTNISLGVSLSAMYHATNLL